MGFLGENSGYPQSHGYGAYDGLTKVTNVGCFAHARRKFMDAKKLQGKGKSGKADIALAKIQKLYVLESRLNSLRLKRVGLRDNPVPNPCWMTSMTG